MRLMLQTRNMLQHLTPSHTSPRTAFARAASLAILCALAATSLSACNKKMIPNTTVEDTEENREIVAVIDKYRQALENRDVDTLVSMASPKYFDNAGTPAKPDDDYDYTGLRAFLEDRFKLLESVKVDIFVKNIEFPEGFTSPRAHVDLQFLSRYQMALPAGSKWASNDERVRIVLVREPSGWYVLSGM